MSRKSLAPATRVLKPKAATADVARLQRLDKDLSWRLYEVRTLYGEDRMSAEDAFKILDQLNRQRQATRRDLGRAKARLEDAERSAAAEERWATWTIEQKRAWIRAHTTAILVHPVGKGSFEAGVEIHYRPGHPTDRVNSTRQGCRGATRRLENCTRLPPRGAFSCRPQLTVLAGGALTCR